MVIALQIICCCLASLIVLMYSVKASMHQKLWPLQRGVGKFATLGHNNVLEKVSLHQGWFLRRYSFFADPEHIAIIILAGVKLEIRIKV